MSIIAKLFEKRGSLKYPPKWLLEWVSGGTSKTGIAINEENALKYSAVFACVRVLAETVASLPLIIYRRLSGKGKERAVDHYLYSVLHDKPNKEQTSFEWREFMMLSLTLWGNSYNELVFNNAGQVAEIWPLLAGRMEVKRNNNTNELVYEYRNTKEQIIKFPAWKILHIRGLSSNGLTGLSPIKMAKESMGLGLAAEEYGARFFANDASPKGLLEHPSRLTPDVRKNIRASWNDFHGGLKGSHRIAVLEEGMKYTQIGIPPEDAQFLETRKFQVNEIARIYRIPPHMIGDLEKATFSNIEHQSIEFVVHTIRPWLVRIEQAFNVTLFNVLEKDVYSEFLVDGLLRGDTKSRYEAYAIGRNNGWLNADEIREMENLNPIPNNKGQIYLIPMNMWPVGSEPVVSGPTREIRTRQDIVKKRRNISNSYKPIIHDVTNRTIRREKYSIIKSAKNILKNDDKAAFQTWLEQYYKDSGVVFKDFYNPVFSGFGKAIYTVVSEELVRADNINIDYERFINEYVDAFVARYTQSSRGQIIQIVDKAYKEGRDPIEAIEERFTEWEETRAAKVANNETIKGENAFAREIMLAAGVTKFMWTTTGKSCPYCNELDGMIVGRDSAYISKGEDFEAQGADGPIHAYGNVRHPPAHQGCQCAIVSV